MFFDSTTGFMRDQSTNHDRITPFDPKRIDFDDYTEANAWQYTFFVPHDIPGLIQAMGGEEKFTAKLDELFETKEVIPNPLRDVCGLIGMYAHGNEPCHHVAYLYDYAGQAWKTQARIRQITSTLYDDSPKGLCGNDDCGQMSAWYVFSAIGFYPVNPASGIYAIGSPLFDKATVHLNPKFSQGDEFTVVAKNNSPKNKFIQSAHLNGKALNTPFITHKQIMAGGTLRLELGAKPNEAWGVKPPER